MSKTYTFICHTICCLFITAVCFAQKDKVVSYDDKMLYGGCWFVPHNTGINIRFTEHSNFKLQDTDPEQGGEVTYTGKFLLDGNNLWLIYNDKPKQKLGFYKGAGADEAFYIKGYPLKTSESYLVHGKCE